MKIIYCRGGDKDAPRVAQEAGMLYGSRHDYTPYAGVYMLDIHWNSYRWTDFTRKVRKLRPELVLCPDYEKKSQLPTLELMIDEIRLLGVGRVAVCPKFSGAVADLPQDIVIAVSVPTSYAGFLPTPEELAGRDLHLLGGHPDQQAFLINSYHQSNVISVDGNILGFKAQFGQFWSVSGGWVTVPKNSVPTLDLKIRSGRNIVEYLQSRPESFETERVERCKQYFVRKP